MSASRTEAFQKEAKVGSTAHDACMMRRQLFLPALLDDGEENEKANLQLLHNALNMPGMQKVSNVTRMRLPLRISFNGQLNLRCIFCHKSYRVLAPVRCLVLFSPNPFFLSERTSTVQVEFWWFAACDAIIHGG